jgi:hypothetical protein
MSAVTSPNVVENDFCLHDDGQVTKPATAEYARSHIQQHKCWNQQLTITQSVHSANNWMSRLQASTNDMWNELPSSSSNVRPGTLSGRPVRIAVIDTGAAIEGDVLEDIYDNRLIECRSWIGEGDPARLIEGATGDKVGHGTHATSLVLKVTENTDCQVYAAQVFERDPQQKRPSGNDLGLTTKAIALVSLRVYIYHTSMLANGFKAVEYAVQHWEVDIISLSFGTDQAAEDVEMVLDEHAHKFLCFAAASNCGGNETGISWPARHGSVISIYASDGHGNSYGQNPNPRENHYNLSMLGSAVAGLWPQALQPNNSRYRTKSGTSCATPIAAGVAANILTLMRRQATMDLSKVPDNKREQESRATERLMKNLRQPPVMRKIMFEIGAKSYKRQGYDHVSPWHIFRGSPEVAFKRIKDVVEDRES